MNDGGRGGQASLELVIVVAAALLLATISLSAFVEVRDSTIAVASLKSLASAELSASHSTYRIQKISFEEGRGSIQLFVHLAPARPALEESVRAALEALAEKVKGQTKYQSVSVEVVQAA